MKLTTPSLDDCLKVRIWRNQCLESLRTPYELTEKMQADFYDEIVSNRHSPHKYYSVYEDDRLVGFAGITNIQWENRIGEISLIINPDERNKGYGEKAVGLLIDKAFNYLGLITLCGEVYKCNPAYSFWEKIIANYKAYSTRLPDRKFWNGMFYDSLYFSFGKPNNGGCIDG